LSFTTDRTRRFRSQPGARYTHPKALEAPAENGAHDSALDALAENAPNYLRWITEMIEPHLGRRVLELGAGIGVITASYAAGREVVASDLSDACVAALRRRFEGEPNVAVVQHDLRQVYDSGDRFDSVVMLNVLEHIEDDVGVLSALPSVLRPGGTIVIYVPALNALYGKPDRILGHFRRYSKWRFREIAAEAGLQIVTLRYVNALAIPAWWVYSHSNTDQTYRPALSAWDRTGVPLSRALEERVRVPVGLNLLAVFTSGHEPPGAALAGPSPIWGMVARGVHWGRTLRNRRPTPSDRLVGNEQAPNGHGSSSPRVAK
jgi:2-polyprenyl-3-methyl-5-hydroxy-6-metoxy-1,4-benzoquinol methylase